MSRPKLSVIPAKTATDLGYEVAAGPYHREHERWMLENAWRGYQGCKVVVVEQPAGLEIWRHASELVDDASLMVVPELAGVKTVRGCITRKGGGN